MGADSVAQTNDGVSAAANTGGGGSGGAGFNKVGGAGGSGYILIAWDTGTDVSALATSSELAKVPKSDSTVTFNATALASIKTQAVAALDDANTELATVPDTTGSIRKMIQFLFQLRRNKVEQTHTTQTMYKEDAATALGAATLTDDGTTYTKGEMTTL